MILTADCAKAISDVAYMSFLDKYVASVAKRRGRGEDPLPLRALVGGLALAAAHGDKLLVCFMHTEYHGIHGRKVKKAVMRLVDNGLVTFIPGMPREVRGDEHIGGTLTQVMMTQKMASSGLHVSASVRGRMRGEVSDVSWVERNGVYSIAGARRKRGSYVCLCGMTKEAMGSWQNDTNISFYGKAPCHGYDAMVQDVDSFNAFMRRHEVTYTYDAGAGAWEERIINTDVHRMFNHVNVPDFGGTALGLGGRYYDEDEYGWQRVRSELRLNYRIDGEEVAENDFSGMNPAIIASLAGVSDVDMGALYFMDMTLFPGVDTCFMRKVVKLMLAIYMNCGTMPAAAHAFASAMDDWGNAEWDDGDVFNAGDAEQVGVLRLCLERWGMLAKMYLEQHTWMAPFMGHGVWGLRCQRFESDVMAMVMRDAVANDIPLLPIHDGLVCRKRDAKWLKNRMEESFNILLGGHAVVKTI